MIPQKTNRPRCPVCDSRQTVSHGISWHCKVCGRNWQKVRATKRALPGGRPPCPSCGGTRVTSSGDEWKCSKCFRKWSKVLRGRTRINDPKRPPCPRCGEPNPVRGASGRWLCVHCNRSWAMTNCEPNNLGTEVIDG